MPTASERGFLARFWCWCFSTLLKHMFSILNKIFYERETNRNTSMHDQFKLNEKGREGSGWFEVAEEREKEDNMNTVREWILHKNCIIYDKIRMCFRF